MSRFVPYLADEAIERDAASLIAEYEHARGVTIEPPIPVENIVEKHLKLRIEFDDMHERHNVPRPESGQTDILGALYAEGSVFIDQSLDPVENPATEGRYLFTLAHEAGHWRLHQHLIRPNTARASPTGAMGRPKFICRSSQAKPREEWQADYYASCLLMPREMVQKVWKQKFGNGKPRKLKKPFSDQFSKLDPDALRSFEVASRPFDEQSMEAFAAPFADIFKVSRQAMRIKLEKLGLLSSGFPKQPACMPA